PTSPDGGAPEREGSPRWRGRRPAIHRPRRLPQSRGETPARPVCPPAAWAYLSLTIAITAALAVGRQVGGARWERTSWLKPVASTWPPAGFARRWPASSAPPTTPNVVPKH